MIKNIVRYIQSILGALIAIFVCFAVLDFLWLGVIADSWYQSEMALCLEANLLPGLGLSFT